MIAFSPLKKGRCQPQRAKANIGLHQATNNGETQTVADAR